MTVPKGIANNINEILRSSSHSSLLFAIYALRFFLKISLDIFKRRSGASEATPTALKRIGEKVEKVRKDAESGVVQFVSKTACTGGAYQREFKNRRFFSCAFQKPKVFFLRTGLRFFTKIGRSDFCSVLSKKT